MILKHYVIFSFRVFLTVWGSTKSDIGQSSSVESKGTAKGGWRAWPAGWGAASLLLGWHFFYMKQECIFVVKIMTPPWFFFKRIKRIMKEGHSSNKYTPLISYKKMYLYVRSYCTKCGVFLCLNAKKSCFYNFHTRDRYRVCWEVLNPKKKGH